MVKTLWEQFESEVASHADQFAIDVVTFYEERGGMVGHRYESSGRVLDVLDPAEVNGNPNFDMFWDWKYVIVFDVKTDCWNDRCRECAHGIDSSLSIMTDTGETFHYESRPGHNPERQWF